MKILVLVFLFITTQVHSQDWNKFENINTKVNFSLPQRPLEIIGEINPNDIGIAGGYGVLYGVPGGGIASALAMLAGHAALVQGQRNEQLDKINNEAKEFATFLNEQLNGISTNVFVGNVLSGMQEGRYFILSPTSLPADQNSSVSVDYQYSITRDFSGLILEIIFKNIINHKENMRFVLYSHGSKSNTKTSYKEDPSKIKKDMILVMEEAFRLFHTRTNSLLIKSLSSKTFRSFVGANKRYERGFAVSEICNRHLYENLSGVWISAPKFDVDDYYSRCN